MESCELRQEGKNQNEWRGRAKKKEKMDTKKDIFKDKCEIGL